MSPMQQIFLGLGAGTEKTYVDNVFSTFVYAGDGGNNRVINNNIDMTEGGLIWTKARNDSSLRNYWYDTVRGKTKRILSDGTDAESTETNDITSFDSTGYKTGSGAATNGGGYDYASWTFRKTPGFCDIVSYTGDNSSNRAISHSLGSAPGLILVKCTSTTKEWQVWHRDQHGNVGVLDTAAAFFSNASRFPTIPTSTNFYVGNDSALNDGSSTYVAYLFAGGESTAATARSVDFDGTDDYLSLGASSDLQLGTGDFTVEGWFKYDYVSDTPAIFDFRSTTGSVTDGFAAFVQASTSKLALYSAGAWIITATNALGKNQWNHFAVVKSSGTIKLYINGTQSGSSYTTSTNFTNNTLKIGSGATGANRMYGWISNFRVVKGTAVYTSSFRPPTEPLTNITNTKLLCCNDSSTTGSTVTPGTITANGNPTASIDSPFDDPAGFVFGSAGDTNVIKCGSYVGSGSAGLEVNVGWEPSWILLKAATGSAKNWCLLDSMRGIVSDGNDNTLFPNESDAEQTGFDRIRVTPTGFQIDAVGGYSDSGVTYIYTCIRRSDGYVGKPPSLGTDVFAVVAGTSNNDIPTFVSGHPTDFTLFKLFAGSGSWYSQARLTGTGYMIPNNTTDETASANNTWDFQNGYYKATGDWSAYLNWMWRRHAGFDVVCYEGTNINNLQVPHGLNAVPEMMWIKNRDASENWAVYHKGLNGGTNPQDYVIRLNSTAGEFNHNEWWNDTAPTSTHFTLGITGETNGFEMSMMAMLFASTKVSKVGSYTGNGSTQTISTGFAPRFVIIRRVDGTEDNWVVLDTTRGWGSGNDNVLKLNSSAGQSAFDAGAPTSTGFSLTSDGWVNYSTGKFIYYAHA
jgi:hypothetical protein